MTFQDIKYREINIISLIVLSVVSALYLGFFIFKGNGALWIKYITQIVITFVFLLIFFILGKISKFVYIGEGDLYTIMALSFTNTFGVLYTLGIFLLALLITLLIPITFFIYNLIVGNRPSYRLASSLSLMFLGYPILIKKITDFYTPLEIFKLKGNKLIRKPKFTPNIEPHKELVSLKKIAKLKNIKEIWVSPLVPFIISIVLGYVIMLFILISNSFPYISGFIVNFL